LSCAADCLASFAEATLSAALPVTPTTSVAMAMALTTRSQEPTVFMVTPLPDRAGAAHVPYRQRARLGDLIRRILRIVPDLPRLRISSIDSIEADPALMEAIGGEPRLMPHLHLSLQAGDDLILKRMKRRHLRDDAIRFCEDAKKLRPDMVFGADIIAGFPTETEAMFENSLKLVADCNLTFLHVFPFSPRKGTPAARMPQLQGPEIKSRAARLRAPPGPPRPRAPRPRPDGICQRGSRPFRSRFGDVRPSVAGRHAPYNGRSLVRDARPFDVSPFRSASPEMARP